MFDSDDSGGAAGDEQSRAVPEVARQVAEVRGLLDRLLADLAASRAPVVSSDPVVPDDRLRSLLVTVEQARNALEAAAADAMVAMGREAQARDAAEAGDGSWRSHEEFVPDEVSVLLSCTRVAASGRYATAWQAQRHPELSAAWRRGTIDRQKVQLIAEGLASLDGVGAASLVEEAVKYASHRTGAQLRQWLRRRVIAADPAAAERRRCRAMADRRVVITPDADGMSTLWAWVPSVQARQVQEVLTSMAHELGGEDARTSDQRRLDVFVDLLLGRSTPPALEVQLVVPAATLAGRSTEPAVLPGVGPLTDGQLGELLGTGEVGEGRGGVAWRRLLTDPVTGTLTDLAQHRYRPSAQLERTIRARDVTCRFPGCRRSASSTGTDLDHCTPWPAGQTQSGNLVVLCRRHHRLKHQSGWSVVVDVAGRVTWTTPSGRHHRTEPWSYHEPVPHDLPPPDPWDDS